MSDAFPASAREYDSYALTLLGKLQQGIGEEEIAAHLGAIERDRMGIGTSEEHRMAVAEMITAWYADRDDPLVNEARRHPSPPGDPR